MTLVVATRNPGKVTEIRAALEGLRVALVTSNHILGDAAAVAETGQTFQENATLKARAIGEVTRLVTLADDSGLEVEALGGRPGVHSARFAREGATDAENNAALLTALADVEVRRARFQCVLALWDPFGGDSPILAHGTCEGTIAREGRGTGGFGYDPLFIVKDLGKTFAELTPAEKLEHSHRGKALRAMRAEIDELVRLRMREADRILTVGSTS
jgi:XTP/dITP diphosphohydrolase